MSTEKRRVKNWDGEVPWTYEGIKVAVLVEIREELRMLNRLLACRNVSRGFQALAKIAARDDKHFKRRVDNAFSKRIKREKITQPIKEAT